MSRVTWKVKLMREMREGTNSPSEDSSSDFRNQTRSGSGMKSKLRKFVTFKTEKAPERSQERESECEVSESRLPPPPNYMTNASEYERASLLTVREDIAKEEDAAPEDYLTPITPSSEESNSSWNLLSSSSFPKTPRRKIWSEFS